MRHTIKINKMLNNSDEAQGLSQLISITDSHATTRLHFNISFWVIKVPQ